MCENIAFDKSLTFCNDFMELHKSEKAKLPYHINLLIESISHEKILMDPL